MASISDGDGGFDFRRRSYKPNSYLPMGEKTVYATQPIAANPDNYSLSKETKKIRKPKPWKHSEAITRAQLMKMREEFWDTAPHYGGRKDKLQEIAYKIDDTVDEWEVENIRQLQLEESEDSFGSSEDPWEKLDSIARENENEFKIIPNIGGISRAFKRDESTSFFEVSKIHGRDLDKTTFMSKLFSESISQGQDGIQIISIVGTGDGEDDTRSTYI
ncbi:hypothetical protein BUALT_BualtUnG0047300 [Buddleja alternifolia]|uniref:DC-UbP/UBTD2 N-terminal domain-containing protein n=1 Tax=Buddleja alternifolia TaxID=168488 RepID=A0AAV6W344_9LAMI|nr:hypothetical protein BUALT_BualtUnG0047300 [Buddleja alternifolia]